MKRLMAFENPEGISGGKLLNQVHTEREWLYPDSLEQAKKVFLHELPLKEDTLVQSDQRAA